MINGSLRDWRVALAVLLLWGWGCASLLRAQATLTISSATKSKPRITIDGANATAADNIFVHVSVAGATNVIGTDTFALTLGGGNAGLFSKGTLTLMGIAPGSTALVTICAWDKDTGDTFESATVKSSISFPAVTGGGVDADGVAQLPGPIVGPGLFTGLNLQSPGGATGAVSDDFESYTIGSNLHGQGGWSGWAGNPNVGALVSSAFAFGPSRSANIAGASDLVRAFSGATGGRWVFRLRQYIPSSSTGDSYIALLNRYPVPLVAVDLRFSVRTHADMGRGLIIADDGRGETLPLLKDRWVEFRCEVDLAAGSVSEFYNGELLSTHPWHDGTGLNEIQALGLYAQSSGSVYYDNVSLSPSSQ